MTMTPVRSSCSPKGKMGRTFASTPSFLLTTMRSESSFPHHAPAFTCRTRSTTQSHPQYRMSLNCEGCHVSRRCAWKRLAVPSLLPMLLRRWRCETAVIHCPAPAAITGGIFLGLTGGTSRASHTTPTGVVEATGGTKIAARESDAQAVTPVTCHGRITNRRRPTAHSRHSPGTPRSIASSRVLTKTKSIKRACIMTGVHSSSQSQPLDTNLKPNCGSLFLALQQ